MLTFYPEETFLFPYQLAAIDLDDTLLGPDKLIGPENARAVQALTTRGIHCVLASGRRHENMLRFHRRLGLSGPIISCNGALVMDPNTDEVLHRKLLPAELGAEIILEGDRLGITQNYYHTDGGLYVRQETGWTDLYETRTGSDVTVHGDLADFGGEAALKIIWIDAPEKIAALYQKFSTRYRGQLYVTTTDPEYLEFMAEGVSKAVGVQTVAEWKGVPQEQVIAFGDGNNDVPMLEWAGLGVAMAHGREAAKAAANLVAPEGDPETSFARAVGALLNQFGER